MIPLAEPNLTGKEQEYVAEAIASGWVSGGGPFVERFEDMVAKACGKRHCIAMVTGTAALHAAMTVLGYCGEIAVPEYTFSASRNVIRMIGGIPVPTIGARIDHDCGKISPTRGSWSIPLFDAAPAIGMAFGGGVFTLSFNGNKTVTTGQGGALLCDDSALADALRTAIRQTQFGGQFNYRMANMNAAMGCAQMERLSELLEKKYTIWSRYSQAGLSLTEAGFSRWMCLIRTPPPKEPCFEIKYLWGSPYWCLPCSTNLTEADQDKVIKCVSSL